MKTYVSKRDGKTYEYPKLGYVNDDGMKWDGTYYNSVDQLVEGLVMLAVVCLGAAGLGCFVWAVGALFK